MKTNDTYNGWKNYETWNIALWVNNDESLYRAFRLIKQRRIKATQAVNYRMIILELGLERDRTPDNVNYISSVLDYEELDEMIAEL